ncbi:hypothetical protein AC578_4021 [Pseudocercospora eumusae]|uniref:Uncharacterized protein n=1 Tax=Pseudocercospora eumusae TaxID=321146 RepID=A0A139HE00_9PEZI|nr:hypothetical protein AC578_4021 [Pseudocercospora eumusae]
MARSRRGVCSARPRGTDSRSDTRTAAAKDGMDAEDNIGHEMRILEHAVSESAPNVLELFRSIWLTYRDSPSTSAIESHNLYEAIAEKLYENFYGIYIQVPPSTKDLRCNVQSVQRKDFQWHRELAGIRLYAIFGPHGCSRTFLKKFRDLEALRTKEHEIGEGNDSNEDDEGHGNDGGRGLTFAEAMGFLREAQNARRSGEHKHHVGASATHEWQPRDCTDALKLAIEREGMVLRRKPAKNRSKKQPEAVEEQEIGNAQDEPEHEIESSGETGQEIEIGGGEDPDGAATFDEEDTAMSLELARGQEHPAARDEDSSLEGDDTVNGGGDVAWGDDESDADMSRNLARKRQKSAMRDSLLSIGEGEENSENGNGFIPGGDATSMGGDEDRGEDWWQPACAPASLQRLFPLPSARSSSASVYTTAGKSLDQQQQPHTHSQHHCDSRTEACERERDSACDSASCASPQFPEAPSTALRDTAMATGYRATKRNIRALSPSLEGGAKRFRTDKQDLSITSHFIQNRLASASQQDLLRIAHRFISAFGAATYSASSRSVLVDYSKIGADPFLIVLLPLPSSVSNGDDAWSQWRLLYIPINDGLPSIEVHGGDGSDHTQSKTRLLDVVKELMPPEMYGIVSAVAEDEYKSEDLPNVLPSYPGHDIPHRIHGFVSCIAAAVCMTTDRAPPRSISLMSWLGAMAVSQCESGGRTSELWRAVELPVSPDYYRFERRFSALLVDDSFTAGLKDMTDDIDQNDDRLHQYVESLTIIRSCCSSVQNPTNTAQGDKIDAKKLREILTWVDCSIGEAKQAAERTRRAAGDVVDRLEKRVAEARAWLLSLNTTRSCLSGTPSFVVQGNKAAAREASQAQPASADNRGVEKKKEAPEKEAGLLSRPGKIAHMRYMGHTCLFCLPHIRMNTDPCIEPVYSNNSYYVYVESLGLLQNLRSSPRHTVYSQTCSTTSRKPHGLAVASKSSSNTHKPPLTESDSAKYQDEDLNQYQTQDYLGIFPQTATSQTRRRRPMFRRPLDARLDTRRQLASHRDRAGPANLPYQEQQEIVKDGTRKRVSAEM